MNRYLIKGAVALAIGVSTVTHPWGFSWQNGQFNVQLGSNLQSTNCDENGCTITQTDGTGNVSTSYVPHGILMQDANGDAYYTDNGNKYRGNGKYYCSGDNCSVIIYPGSSIHYGRTYVHNLNAEQVAGNDQIVMRNKVVFPLKACDRIQYKRNGKIRINGEKLNVKKLSGEHVDIPAQEMVVNAVDVPGYLAQVHVGNESRISCDSAIAPIFDVKDGKLTASLDTAYKYKYKGKSPCDVFVKLLGYTLQATNDSSVKLDEQPILKLDASGTSAITGSTVSFNGHDLRIRTSDGANVEIHDNGRRNKVVLHAQSTSKISVKDMSANILKVKSDSSHPICVDGEVDKQRVTLGKYGQYYAQNLKTRICTLHAGLYSFAKLYVTKKLSGRADSYSKVWYRGEPKAGDLIIDYYATWRRFSGPFE